jgi:translation initiation factor IF-2
MGKIRVQDLARMMQISNQDLIFKLKSIGVRVEGDDAHIDTDIISAILQGKKLPHPREVILRDAHEQPAAPGAAATPAARRRAVPPPRTPVNPLRPNRPRTIIQRVEPRIQTLPASERPAHVPMAYEEMIPDEQEVVEMEASAVHEPIGVEVDVPAAEPAPAATVPMVEAPSPAPPAPVERTAERTGEPPRPAPRPEAPRPPQQPQYQPSQRPGSSYGSQRPAQPGGGGRPPMPGRPPQGPSGPGGNRPGMGARPGGPPSGGGGMRPGGPPGRPGGPGGMSTGRPGSAPAPGRPGSGPAPTRPGGPGAGRPGGGGPMSRPGGPPGSDDRRRPGLDPKKAKKGGKKPGPHIATDEELAVFKGSVRDLEDEETVTVGGTSTRRRRRAQRRVEEKGDGGKLLTFKKAAPEGTVTIAEGMTVRDFSEKLGVKSRDLIKALFKRGVMANINHVLEPELAQELASELGIDALVVSFEEEVQLREELQATTGVEEGGAAAARARVARGPVVTIMGHVDHGKTSLLDAIRSSKVTESEFGGITQHIGAYQVETHGRKIVFVDTPGHEAFTMMRARGAKVTDIVVLVVAADDGVMPQTIEAIDHARAAKVPIVVAVNKMDKANANPDRVKKELSDRGLMPEDWGGDTVTVPISALKKEGINELLDMILLTADILDLKATPELSAQGVVLEARKEVGRGIVASVLVQNGTLKVGDIFVSGATWGRVRSMSDDLGKRAKEAGPATPVEVTGFNEVPDAGDLFQVLPDEIQARNIAEFRALENRKRDLAPGQGRLSLAQLFDRIQEGEIKELAVVLKADVQGSVEVLREALGKIISEKVKLNVIHSGVGAISTNDVLLASASKAIVLGFNVRPERSAVELAEKEGVDIRLHTVIYELMDELRKAMTGLLSPTFKEVSAGRAEVRDTFKVPKIGLIAGCHVIDGTIPRTAAVRLLRDNRVIYEGKISSLRRFKDDVSEVRSGFDCGIGLERFQDMKPGDIIEAHVREEVAPVL